MNYSDLDIKISYKSRGNENIASSLLNPSLKCTKLYQRSVGYFSSGVFSTISEGIMALVQNQGNIQLVASPKLDKEDIDAINAAYDHKETVITSAFKRDFNQEVNLLDDDNIKLLYLLIERGVLDIRIAVSKSLGAYHDKLGILRDFDGNVIVFYGSANSSINGYRENYEKIRVISSLKTGNEEQIADEINEFELIWSGHNPEIETHSFKDAAKKNLLEIMEKRGIDHNSHAKQPVELRDYQKEAIAAWVRNDYHGFFVMATGTGKTWTALFAYKELLKNHNVLPVIIAPYKHLIKQWAEDIEKLFANSRVVLISSENSHWEAQLTNEIIKKKYYPDTQLIIISTIASFNMDKFRKTIKKSNDEKLLIVDEAHRFTQRLEEYKQDYKFMLGLSATPFSGSSARKGNELMQFFGGQVYSLTLEDALAGHFLVPYSYHPIFVAATDSEEEQFKFYSAKIASCFGNNGRCINPDLLVKSLRARLRVISMSDEKRTRIDDILEQVELKDHFIVYCGDGKLFDGELGKEVKHISSIKKVLSSHDYKVSQFTCTEDMDERMVLVDEFNKGNISSLVAIRCLDEGINIPSIKSALILSSNDDYREFVQRRGRILRKYEGKETASIYDVVVMPSQEMTIWAKIELRRLREFAHLAINWNDILPILDEKLAFYGLSDDDINVFEYDDLEDNTDE